MKSEKSAAIPPSKNMTMMEALSKITNKDLLNKIGHKDKEFARRAIMEEKKSSTSDFVVRCAAKRT